MLIIRKNQSSTIYPTFSENMLNPDGQVIVNLINETTKDEYNFVLSNNGTLHPNRYDIYTITETNDIALVDPMEAVIRLRYSGFYIYTAYVYDPSNEKPIEDYTEADFSELKFIETGRLQLIGDDESIHEAYR